MLRYLLCFIIPPLAILTCGRLLHTIINFLILCSVFSISNGSIGGFMVLLSIGHALYIVSNHHDKNPKAELTPKAEPTSDESVKEKPKMGLGKKILIAGAAKAAHNKVNPPTVIAPPGIEYLGCKAKGLNDYTIFYRRPPSNVKEQFTISRNIRSSTGIDGVDWEFHFN